MQLKKPLPSERISDGLERLDKNPAGESTRDSVTALEAQRARSGWDVVAQAWEGAKKWLKYIAIGIAFILSWIYIGWFAGVAVLVGVLVSDRLADWALKGRYNIVDVINPDGTYDTFGVGVERFKELKKEGGPLSPIMSSGGTLRYWAEAFDNDAGTIRGNWISKQSTFDFVVDYRTYGRLVKFVDSNLDAWVDAVGMAQIYGKIKASEVVKALLNDINERLGSLDPKRYNRASELPHEIIRHPDQEDKAPAEEHPAEAEGEGDSSNVPQ